MKQNILIFSSHITHSEQTCATLRMHGISPIIVFNAREAMILLASHPPAFFWLDVDAENAQLFLAEMVDRVLYPPPYIILTSSFASSTARAVMLNQGADICIEIPVDLSEILAVLNAVLRRSEQLNRSSTGTLLPCIEHKELLIDPLRRKVMMRGHLMELTRKEYEVLYLLASSPGVVMTREQIYSRIWKEERHMVTSIVTDHVSSLRQKLGLNAKDSDYIQTVFGVGYRFTKSQ